MRKFDYLYLILILVIIFNVFYPAELHQTTAPLLIYVIFLIYLSYKIELVYLHKKLEMPKQLLLSFTFLGMFLIITSLNGIYLSQSLDQLFIIFSFIMIFAFVRSITLNEWKIWNGLYLLLLASSIICIYSMLQYTTDFFSLADRLKDASFLSQQDREIMMMRLAQKRVNAFFAFTTTLSSFLTMIIPINIGVILKNKSTVLRIFFSLILSLHLVVLFLTKSYGGIVTLLGVAAFLAAYFLFRRSRMKFKQLALLILAAFILVSLIVTIGYLRGGLFHFKDPANPIVLRLANWNVALKIIGDFPSLGVGLGNYGTVFPKYYTPDIQPSQFAHNTYLQIFSEVGVVGGLFLLIYFIWWFLRILTKGTKKELILPLNYILYFTLLSSFTAFLINNIFEINAYYPSIGFIGVYIGALLDKSSFQCKKTDRGAVYLHSTASREGNITFREKSAVGLLIAAWLCVTFLLSLRFVGLLLYDTAGEKYLQYDLNSAGGNISVAKLFDPIDSRYHYLSSLILFEKYKTFRDKEFINDALDSAQTAVNLNPKMPYLRANLSSMLFYTGRIWQSLYQLKYADSLMPYAKKYSKEVDLFSDKLFHNNRDASPSKDLR
jgi:O-antigen ligase